MEKNYYEGLVEGLHAGSSIIKGILEVGGVSQDDLLESYNKLTLEAYTAYQNMLSVNPQGNLFGESLTEDYNKFIEEVI